MQPAQSHALVLRHIEAFDKEEREVWDRLLKFYQGRFYTDLVGASESDILKTSVNITFAVVETALSNLLPKHPAVTCVARRIANADRVENVEKVINLAFDDSDYYSELVFGVQDAVLYGRGIFKVTWDEEADLPVVRSCDPRTVFFDVTARRQKDIRYWIEVTTLSKSEFRDRVANGQYKNVPDQVLADEAPSWLRRGTSQFQKDLQSYQPWVTIYEVYDVESNKVRHFHPSSPVPLFEDELIYIPYAILTLNNNGEDMRGLSEIALISANQEELNNLLSFILEIVRTTIPKVAYDAAAIDENDVAAGQKAKVNSMIPMRTKQGKTLKDSMVPWPQSSVPTAITDLIQRFWDHISFVSALADAQRGQVTGAKTATELALIEGQLRNRLSARQSKIDGVTKKVAELMLLISAKYMKHEKVVKVTGEEPYLEVDPMDLGGIRAVFDVVPYDPMESNRAVIQEQFLKALDFLQQNELIDKEELTKEYIRIFAMSPRLLLKQKQAAPEAPPMPPPGAMPPGPMPPPVGVPPTPLDPMALQQATGTIPSAAPLPPTAQLLANQQVGAPIIAPPPPGAVAQAYGGQ